MPFSTAAANEAFKSEFTTRATALAATVGMQNSGELYAQLGKLWAATESALAKLKDTDAHQPAADSNLKEDVAAEVEQMLQSLWIDYAPKIGGRGAVTPLRIKGSIEKAYTVAIRGAASHNAAAADRAAADPFLGLPQRTPQEFSIGDDPDEARGDAETTRWTRSSAV